MAKNLGVWNSRSIAQAPKVEDIPWAFRENIPWLGEGIFHQLEI